MAHSEWITQAADEWNKRAASWHAESAGRWEKGSRKKILPLLTTYVKQEDGPLLDAGCGDGYASWKLALQGYTVEGVDLSTEMIEWAQKRVADGAKLHFQQGDISSLPFADETFAGIFSINVVEFTPFPLKTLREFHRLLRRNGHLLLGILGPTAGPRAFSYRRLYDESIIQNTMMPWEAKQLAEENGFTTVEMIPVYKEAISPEMAASLPADLQQAVSFMTLFVLRKA
ncbi:class I SAM-dependent methyltransferase [Brevibacillus fluminis]|uniref:class I SAM-dependent methyltransferase n=1 Tax=Brevibacillus fluminis TaxID=511487 RepID=UPI003F8B6DD0